MVTNVHSKGMVLIDWLAEFCAKYDIYSSATLLQTFGRANCLATRQFVDTCTRASTKKKQFDDCWASNPFGPDGLPQVARWGWIITVGLNFSQSAVEIHIIELDNARFHDHGASDKKERRDHQGEISGDESRGIPAVAEEYIEPAEKANC